MRPDKNTVDYYPHYCEEGGKTLFILENTFGNDGYAFWFKLLSLLGRTPGHFFDAHDRHAWLFLIAKTHVSEDIANGIMGLLVDLEAIDRELWERDRVIWCQNFVDHLSDLYARRKGGAIPQKPGFRVQEPSKCQQEPGSDAFPLRDDGNKPQTKLNQSKPKESKETSGSQTDPDATPEPPTKPSKEYPQEVHTLCKTLANLIAQNDPGFKVKGYNGWLTEMDRLIRLDNRTPDEIEKVIRWAQADTFWHKNILSAATLREKFTRLNLEMQAKAKNGGNGKASSRYDENMAVIRKSIEDAEREEQSNGQQHDCLEIAGDDGNSFAGQESDAGICDDLPGDVERPAGRGTF